MSGQNFAGVIRGLRDGLSWNILIYIRKKVKVENINIPILVFIIYNQFPLFSFFEEGNSINKNIQ
jgi:hypothetical protein